MCFLAMFNHSYVLHWFGHEWWVKTEDMTLPRKVNAKNKRSIDNIDIKLSEGPAGGLKCTCHFSATSGLWRVEDITGVSKDTCIYHLRANPPGNPHPFPQSAWHIQVFVGSNVREPWPLWCCSFFGHPCINRGINQLFLIHSAYRNKSKPST